MNVKVELLLTSASIWSHIFIYYILCADPHESVTLKSLMFIVGTTSEVLSTSNLMIAQLKN